MKKKLLLVLMLIAAVVVMPRVSALDAMVVEDITNVDTLTGDKKGAVKDENGNYTITYDEAEFKVLEKGTENSASDGRPEGYAWVGFRIKLTDAVKGYKLQRDGKDPVEKTTNSGANDVDKYVGISVDNLTKAAAKGENLVYSYTLYLYGEENSEEPSKTQTIKVIVVPKGITLKDDNATTEDKTVWNEEEFKENAKVIVNVVAVKDGKVVELEEPLSLTVAYEAALSNEELDKIKSVLTDADLVGLYTDEKLENELDPTTKLTENTTVYVAYKTKVEEPAPNTVDNAVMYIALAGASLLVAGIIAVHFKKANE